MVSFTKNMSLREKTLLPILSRISSIPLSFKKATDRVTILAYHRVMDIPEDYQLDEGVISTTPETFEKEIQFCREHFHFISFQTLKDHLTNQTPLPRNPLIVTFDDGYRDNYTHVFPILKEYEATATIFLAVHYIETGELFWWDIASAYVKQNSREPQKNIKRMLRALKRIPDADRNQKIKELSVKMGKNLSQVKRQVMTWDEIREMSEGGIEFGSHTMTHPVLSQVKDPEQLRWELAESKKILEDRLQKEVTTLSYPVGGKTAFNELTKTAAREAGYDFAVNYMHGINHLGPKMDRYDLKRLDADKLRLEKFKIKLSFPGLFK